MLGEERRDIRARRTQKDQREPLKGEIGVAADSE